MSTAPVWGGRRGLWPAIIAAASVLGAVMAFGWMTPESDLRNDLIRWQFRMLELQFIFVAAATVHQLPRLLSALHVPRRTWLAVGASALLCLALSGAVAPRTSRILFDEQIYQSIGRSLAETRLAQMCNEGTLEYGRLQCTSGEYNKQPYGYPYLLSVAYRVVGVRPWVAPAVNNLAAVSLVLVVFLIGMVMFDDALAALMGALVMTLLPMQLAWSNTAAAEPSAALMCAVAILAALQFARTRTTPALAWAMSTTVFAAAFRPESLLVAPLVLGIVLLFAPGELRRPRWWWFTAAAAALGWTVVAHMWAIRHEPWGSSGTRVSLEFLGRNLASNTWFYVWDERFPAVFTLLAIAGVVTRRTTRAAWTIACYFLAFWGVFLLFYAGSYDFGADVRYSLMTYAPMAVLAGAGAASVIRRVSDARRRTTAVRAAVALLLFHFLAYVPLVRALGEEAWAARADVEYVERAVRALPPNAMVLTHTPSTFHLLGINAAQTSIATNDEARVRRDYFERYAGGVYFHWNYWCNVANPAQKAYCDLVLSRFDHELVSEERVRNYRYALYRLREAPPDEASRAR